MRGMKALFASLALALALAFTLVLLTPAPLSAQSQDEVLQAALLPGWQASDGSRMAALHLLLAPEWKTYWRAPGEAGIPPSFDWSASHNLAGIRLHWPSPEVFHLGGMQSIGYHQELVLPVEVLPIDPTQPVELHLKAFLGICKDICLPASLTLEAALSGRGAPDARIDRALSRGPLSADQAGVTRVSCAAEPIEDGLHLKAHVTLPRQGSPETMVFETSDPAVWVAEASASRAGSVLTGGADMVSESAEPFMLDRSGVTITIIGQGRSVEIKGCPAP
jgi:DsbC/DsbD-like thiol-disulfide interchange protein